MKELIRSLEKSIEVLSKAIEKYEKENNLDQEEYSKEEYANFLNRLSEEDRKNYEEILSLWNSQYNLLNSLRNE